MKWQHFLLMVQMHRICVLIRPWWKAMAKETVKKMWRVFDEMRLFVCLCCHGSLLIMCDMVQSGEL